MINFLRLKKNIFCAVILVPSLNSNDNVRMQPIDGSKDWKQATVVTPVENNSRSYIVEDEEGSKYR